MHTSKDLIILRGGARFSPRERNIFVKGKFLDKLLGIADRKGRDKCHQEPKKQKSVGKLVCIRCWWGGGQRREGEEGPQLNFWLVCALMRNPRGR